MLKKSVLILIMLLISSILVFAGGFDDRGEPNDPAVNERANACYEGGTLEGKCDTQLEWDAGWYLIRYESGILTREEIPGWVAWVIPEEVLPEELSPVSSNVNPVPVGGCETDGGNYYDFGGGYFLPQFSPSYTDPGCTNLQPGIVLGADVVYAPPGYDAFTLCGLIGTYSGVSPAVGSGLYICQP